jgi:lia operon protein LiaF
LIVILVGVVFLGRNLNWFEWDLSDMFSLIGPVILILFGIGMIARGANPKRRKGWNDRHDRHGYGWNPVTPPPMADRPAAPPGPPPAPPLTDDPNASFSEPIHGTPPGPEAEDRHGGIFYGQQAGYSPPRPDSAPPFDDAPNFHDKRDRCRNRQERREQRWHWRHSRHDGWSSDPNAAQHHRFVGDVHIGRDYWELRPMNISHFIGDTTLDLTKAQIPLGETKIYVSCFIGDVKVFVPNDLSVGVQVVSSSLIGDVRVWDQKRGGLFNHMSVETPSYADADKRVVLIASAFIGDVRVTKVG